MKTKIVQMVALTFGLILAAALQDLAPGFAGVKPPFLIAGALFAALTAPLVTALAFAVVAGLVCDALAGVSSFAATGFFVLLALAGHYARAGAYADEAPPRGMVGAFAVPVAAALAEVWFAICGVNDVGLLVGICAAAIWGVPVGAGLFALLPVVGRHIGWEEST